MANYLPVLLVSVVANSIPDDSALSTLPRGQVDYLSHDWEEEDVWRSWRNMTRQKNEIANGIRLENASWRTWWKRRNGLGTVTPETLNWLKDSDVTWLYGPLHTASDWTPLRKQEQLPSHPAVSFPLPTTTKPILKHRSIGEFLTSALPPSARLPSPPRPDQPELPLPDPLAPDCPPPRARRPSICHTKSDTHVTSWGYGRDIRRDSQSVIVSPAPDPHPNPALSLPTPRTESVSSSNANSDSIPNSAISTTQPQKKRHISFNTFVQQYIAIEKPPNAVCFGYDDDDDDDDEDDMGAFIPHSIAGRYPYGRNPWGYDDGYEEDEEEDSAEEAISPSAWEEGSDGNPAPGSDSDSLDDCRELDDDLLRPPHLDPRKSSLRSHSMASNASSSSSTSTSTSVSTPSTSSNSESQSRRSLPPRRASTSSLGTHRPHVRAPPISSSSSSSSTRQRRNNGTSPSLTVDYLPTQHVTIAPIPPTILKTGAGSHHGAPGGWVEGFGDEGGSDDGILGGGNRCWNAKGEDDERGDGDGTNTPVELVYVPPLGTSHYMRWSTTGRPLPPSYKDDRGTRGRYTKKYCAVEAEGAASPSPDGMGASVPTVVIRRPAGESVMVNVSLGQTGEQRGRGGIKSPRSEEPQRGRQLGDDRSRSRSKSRSRSRTPSPNLMPGAISPNSPPMALPSSPAETDKLRAHQAVKGASTSPPSSTGLLSPPLREHRSRSHQDLQSQIQQSQTQTRGRSNTRVFCADRERGSSGHTSSSLSSLSPDGSTFEISGGRMYAGGRPDRERETRRSERKWSPETPSLSLQETAMRVAAGGGGAVVAPPLAPSQSSSSSSSGSSATVVPPRRELVSSGCQIPPVQDWFRSPLTPTPTNSPVATMRTTSYVSSSYAQKKREPPNPVLVPSVQPAAPSTSFCVSRSRDQSVLRSPTGSTRSEATIVGKAVEMVSNAGAYLGLWSHVSSSSTGSTAGSTLSSGSD